MSQGHNRVDEDAIKFTSITPSELDLDELGRDGWELTSSYLEMETSFPNFGDKNYVAGIQPNIRPQRVVFIFKRPLLD